MPPSDEPTPRVDIHTDEFLYSLMRKQLRISISCAVAFLVVLLGLPLANYFLPELMGMNVLGFTLSWLILGILLFPFVWVISFIFIKKSIALEEQEAREVEEGK